MWRYVTAAVAVVLIGAATVLLWSGAAGSRSPGTRQTPAADGAMDAFDVAQPPEASDKTREARRFARYDADRNGAVSRDEYLLARRKAYARLDLDGDGKLSFDEYAAKAARKFADADKDRTGALNAQEFEATRVVRKNPPRANCPPGLQAAKRTASPDDDS